MDPNFGRKRMGNTGRTVQEEMTTFGLNYNMDLNDDLIAGHLKVKELLKYDALKPVNAINKPKLFIMKRCRNHWTALKNYGYKKFDRYNPPTRVIPEEKYKHFADLIRYLAMSGFGARTVDRTELQGKPVQLALDDGRPAGKKSMAGSGHAVGFDVAGRDWYLTSVRIYGSRYGRPRAPNEDFHVWLCDADFRVIADFPFPYARFRRGGPGWVRLDVDPTNVPEKFTICVGFNPTATKGVFLHHDGQGSDHSSTGLPGRGTRRFQRGDWMIRAHVDQPKLSDPLK